MASLRLLFVGSLTPYLTTAARRDAFAALGAEVECVDQRSFVVKGPAWLDRLSYWSLATPPVFAFNRAIREAARRFRPQVAWIEKGTFVFPRTLRALRGLGGTVLVYHNTDDWRAQTRLARVHWRHLLRGLSLYDLHFTSNAHNVREFREHGLPRVHHMELAANEALRDPRPLSEEERRRLGGPVGFIGHHEPDTERSIRALADAGIPVRVYGAGWEAARQGLGEAIQNRQVWGEEYARAICSFDVNLGIVSKWNRSHTASRTFQIPALGAFLLHERNEVVTRYFREGEEAEFFATEDELVDKARHYLAHPDERRRVAEAGRRRCIESGYFETDRVREILPLLEEAMRTTARGTA